MKVKQPITTAAISRSADCHLCITIVLILKSVKNCGKTPIHTVQGPISSAKLAKIFETTEPADKFVGALLRYYIGAYVGTD